MRIRAQMEKLRKKPDRGMSSHDDAEPDRGDGVFKKAGRWMLGKAKDFVKDF